MELQPKTPPEPLSRKQLSVLRRQIYGALGSLQKTDTPDSLGHMDLNPGNIFCSPGGAIFLDWAETFIGHPFLAFQYLLEGFRRTFGRGRPQEAPFIESYSLPWRACVSERDVRQALNLTSLIAVFACAVGSEVWKDPQRLKNPRTAAYLRSLTRRMYYEAHVIEDRSVSCLN